MLRAGSIATGLVVVAWGVLTIAAFRSHDGLAGVAVPFLALYAAAAVGLIWLVVFFTRVLIAASRAAHDLRSDPGQ